MEFVAALGTLVCFSPPSFGIPVSPAGFSQVLASIRVQWREGGREEGGWGGWGGGGVEGGRVGEESEKATELECVTHNSTQLEE